jgi:hypothetical protein
MSEFSESSNDEDSLLESMRAVDDVLGETSNIVFEWPLVNDEGGEAELMVDSIRSHLNSMSNRLNEELEVTSLNSTEESNESEANEDEEAKGDERVCMKRLLSRRD